MLIIRLPTKTLKNNIVKIPFDSLYENVVIDLIGKANSNIAVICKRFYMYTLKPLSISIRSPSKPVHDRI